MAHDFRNKTFQKVLRGYAPEEVDDYIAYLNDEYRKLERRTADSERKLALALKKLDESVKNGGGTAGEVSVGPAAREAAAKLLREAEMKRSEILAMTERQANENAERIIHDAEERAGAVLEEAAGQAEAILTEAKAQAESHRQDVQTIYKTARGMYEEIGAFREKLFGLYNDHLDAIEGISESAVQFINGIDERYAACAEEETESPLNEEEPDGEWTAAEESPAEENFPADEEFPDELPEEEPVIESSADDEEFPEELPADEPEEQGEDAAFAEEVASNLAFMDRLFAAAKPSAPAEDLYIEIPDELEEDGADFADVDEFFPDELDMSDEPDNDLPAITIDWKNRSAAQVGETVVPDESTDFRPAEGFEEFEEDYEEYEDEAYEENYDDYGPTAEELTPEKSDEEELDEELDEEDEEYRAMDALFHEDKSQRDMSLTDEFNIIFADSKSNANVKEIRRQPTVAPEAPKNPKKHKNF